MGDDLAGQTPKGHCKDLIHLLQNNFNLLWLLFLLTFYVKLLFIPGWDSQKVLNLRQNFSWDLDVVAAAIDPNGIKRRGSTRFKSRDSKNSTTSTFIGFLNVFKWKYIQQRETLGTSGNNFTKPKVKCRIQTMIWIISILIWHLSLFKRLFSFIFNFYKE